MGYLLLTSMPRSLVTGSVRKIYPTKGSLDFGHSLFSFFKNEFEKPRSLPFQSKHHCFVLFCFYMPAFAGTRNGKGQDGKFRWPPLGCLDFP